MNDLHSFIGQTVSITAGGKVYGASGTMVVKDIDPEVVTLKRLKGSRIQIPRASISKVVIFR